MKDKDKEIHGPDEISVSELSAESGLSIEYILMLVKRGVIPPGRKVAQTRLLPAVEARLAVIGRRSTGKRSAKVRDISLEGWAI